MPDSILGFEDIAANEIDRSPSLMDLTILQKPRQQMLLVVVIEMKKECISWLSLPYLSTTAK